MIARISKMFRKVIMLVPGVSIRKVVGYTRIFTTTVGYTSFSNFLE